MEIPPDLLRQVKNGQAVLYLGAGASAGAIGPDDSHPPNASKLAILLSDEFLGGAYRDSPLHVVAELAISERDLLTVQEYIRSIFQVFWPAPFHLLMPTFAWTGIATTNFDLVVERAYEACPDRVQNAIPMVKNGDRVEQKLRTQNGIMLLKLHGCISYAADSAVPLILTVDQYVTHRAGRDRVFDHLKNWAYEHTIIFVGQRLQDSDIRQMLLELGTSEERPRFYTVTPDLSEAEERLWTSKRISPLEGTFEEFLRTLDEQIRTPFRGAAAAVPAQELPISERFVVREPGLTEACRSFLAEDVDYVRLGMPAETIEPQRFYRGFPGGWSAIDQGLDVRRGLATTILSDIVLPTVSSGTARCRLYVIKAPAGSGKSVLLRRMAWEAAITLERLCLFLRPHGIPTFDVLREIAQVTGEHIFLFVDSASDHVPSLAELVAKGRRGDVPLTIFTTERHNEWNMSCEGLDPYVDDDFELHYLSHGEIENLLTLLDRHHSLGTLAGASPSEKMKALEDRAGRQLLVALHEATLGKPFEDIIADEYSEIKPDLAQQIYLGICVLNRSSAPVRAGIIARAYGVRFTQFRERFFRPLEQVVFTSFDNRVRDYVYAARHPHIAEIVFERILSTARDRADVYRTLIRALNVDYDADRAAFRRLCRAREVLDLFPDHNMAQGIFDVCQEVVGDDAYLLHQRGIYEMRRENGSLQTADELLRRAQELAPRDTTIIHSLAELALTRAERSSSPAEAEAHLRDVHKLAQPLIGPRATTAHGYHTVAKARLARLRNLLLRQTDDEFSDHEADRLIKEAADVIDEGLQRFPGDGYLLDTESDLGQLIADDERALAALRKAFQANPQSGYAAVRLAKHLSDSGLVQEARRVYEQALEAGSADKRVHYGYAQLLLDLDPEPQLLEYHLRRAFTVGDRNYEAQYWYARQLYINGKTDESRSIFRSLRDCAIPPDAKRRIRGVMKLADSEQAFSGTIGKVESSYAFVQRDGPGDWVFLHAGNLGTAISWADLRTGMRVSFSLGFNFFGPVAFRIRPE